MEIGMNMDSYNENLDRDFSHVYGLDNTSQDTKPKRKVRGRAKNVEQGKNTKESELKLGSSAFLDKAWKVGYKAAQTNIPENRNPFFVGTSEYELWIEGWWSGFYEK